MNKVTLWYKIIRNDDGNIVKLNFNHLQDGWVEGLKPLPLHKSFTNQRAWLKEEWCKKFKYISNGRVV